MSDSVPMGLDDLAPDLREAAAMLARGPDVTTPIGRLLGRHGARLLPSGDQSGVVRRTVPVARGVSAQLMLPTTFRADSALLWLHGGGFVSGHPTMNNRLLARVVRELGLTVVSVDYRRSPAHAYPAALDDAEAAWRRLAHHADALRVDPARVVVGGQSAGGGLAAQLALRLRDAGGVQPLGQWLFAPVLDDRTAADTTLDARAHLGWTNAQNRVAWRHYLGAEPGRTYAPAGAVPARVADLSGLPPAWIGIGDIDLFADEAGRYAERLRAASVPVEFVEVPGAAHGFDTWAADAPTTLAHQDEAIAWLSRIVAR